MGIFCWPFFEQFFAENGIRIAGPHNCHRQLCRLPFGIVDSLRHSRTATHLEALPCQAGSMLGTSQPGRDSAHGGCSP